MNPDLEIRRLLDVMPASGRMMAKIISKPEQSQVIECPFPLPWSSERPILINFDLWRRLKVPQRDLLILRTVGWLMGIKWFKPDLYQGIVIVGLLGGIWELTQQDVVGVVVAGGLSAIAVSRIWRNNTSSQLEIEADLTAVRVAQRRGYSEVEAAEHLLSAIENVGKIEGRYSLSFAELIRSQNLRAIAGISPLGVPESVKQER